MAKPPYLSLHSTVEARPEAWDVFADDCFETLHMAQDKEMLNPMLAGSRVEEVTYARRVGARELALAFLAILARRVAMVPITSPFPSLIPVLPVRRLKSKLPP